MLGLFLRFVCGSSYAGANIKVDFKAGFTRTPLANSCSSHLHLSISYMLLKNSKLTLLLSVVHGHAEISLPTLHYKEVIVILTSIFFICHS